MSRFEDRQRAFDNGQSGGPPPTSGSNEVWAEYEAGRRLREIRTTGQVASDAGGSYESSQGGPDDADAALIGICIAYSLALPIAGMAVVALPLAIIGSPIAWIMFKFNRSEKSLGFSIWPVYISINLCILTAIFAWNGWIFVAVALLNAALLRFHVPRVMDIVSYRSRYFPEENNTYVGIWFDIFMWREFDGA